MENDGIQIQPYHREQIGGQTESRFTLTDLFEDYNDYGELAKFIRHFVATRAVRNEVIMMNEISAIQNMENIFCCCVIFASSAK